MTEINKTNKLDSHSQIRGHTPPPPLLSPPNNNPLSSRSKRQNPFTTPSQHQRQQFSAIPIQNQNPISAAVNDSNRDRPGSYQRSFNNQADILQTPPLSQQSGQPSGLLNRTLRDVQQIGTTMSNKSRFKSNISSNLPLPSIAAPIHPIEHQFDASYSGQTTGRYMQSHSHMHSQSIDRGYGIISSKGAINVSARRHGSVSVVQPPKVKVKRNDVIGSSKKQTQLKTQTEPLSVKMKYHSYNAEEERLLNNPKVVQQRVLANQYQPGKKIAHPKIIQNTYIPRAKGTVPGKSVRPVSLINLKRANYYLKIASLERNQRELQHPQQSPRNKSPPTVTAKGVNLSSDTALDFHITDFLDYDRKVQLLKDKDNVNQLFKRQIDDTRYKYVIRNYRLVKVPKSTNQPVADLNKTLLAPSIGMQTPANNSSIIHSKRSQQTRASQESKPRTDSIYASTNAAEMTQFLEQQEKFLNSTVTVQNSIINPKKYRFSTRLTDYSVIDMMNSTLNQNSSFNTPHNASNSVIENQSLDRNSIFNSNRMKNAISIKQNIQPPPLPPLELNNSRIEDDPLLSANIGNNYYAPSSRGSKHPYPKDVPKGSSISSSIMQPFPAPGYSVFDNQEERMAQLISATSGQLSSRFHVQPPSGPGFFDMPHFPMTTTGQALIQQRKKDQVRGEYNNILSCWYQPKSSLLQEKERIKGKGYFNPGDLYTPNVALNAFGTKTQNPYPYLRSLQLVEDEYHNRKQIGQVGDYHFDNLKNTLSSLQVSVIHPVTFSQVKVALSFNRHFMTHLEKQRFPSRSLPLQLFEDASQEENQIMKQIEQRQEQIQDPIEAQAIYSNLDGSKEWQKCRIIKYDPSTKKYLIEFMQKSVGVRRQISRFYLKMQEQSEDELFARRKAAEKLRNEAQARLNTENFFISQMATRYPYLKIEPSHREIIKKKIGFKLQHFDSKYLKRLILQVQALYVHAILKSIIASQVNDPHISTIVKKFNVIKQQQNKVPLNALKSYELNDGKRPLSRMLTIKEGLTVLNNYSLIGNTDYVESIRYLLSQIVDVVNETPLFEFPFSNQTLFKLRNMQEEYENLEDDQLVQKFQNIPMSLNDFLRAARSLTHRYKKTLQQNFVQDVGLHIRDIIEKQFNIMQSGEINVSNLNPYLVKLFEHIRLRMERAFYEKYISSLQSYSDLLQSFFLRNPDFVHQPAYIKTGLNKRLITINPNPLVLIDLRVKKQGAGIEQRLTVTTQPDLLQACQELFELNNAMLSACSMINRMDSVIFPLLIQPSPKLRPPNTKDQEIRRIQKGIAGMLHFSIQRAYKRINEIRKFAHVLGKQPSKLIMDLKKQTHQQFAEETSQGYGSEQEEQLDNEQDLNILEEEQDRIARIEIPNQIYMNQLTYLRQMYWGVRLQIEDEMNFDFFEVRCREFKNLIASHSLTLIKKIEEDIMTSLLQKLHEIIDEFQIINKKVSQHVATIDDVIHLLEYIDQIQKPNQKIDLLTHDISFLKTRFDFFIKAQFILQDKEMESYYNLLNTPRTMRAWLLERRTQLERERTRLSKLMEKEKMMLLDRIHEFEQRLEQIKKLGMIFDQGESDQAGDGTPANAAAAAKAKDKKKTKKVGKDQRWSGRFDSNFVSKTAEDMAQLKSQVEQVELQSQVINRRESLLGLKITKFSLLGKLQQQVKPFGDLWYVAYQWVKTVPMWLQGSFQVLDAQEIEDTANEWWRTLQRLTNSNVKKYNSPTNLLYYVLDQLQKFRLYIPMISALRTKGLGARHWGIISAKFNVDLQPQYVTLQQLIDMKLWDSENLAIIKGISEIALKEYVIENTLDSLQSEFRVIEYFAANYRDKDTWIIKGLDDLMGLFQQFSLKVEALKSNPYVTHFLERLGMFERNLRTVIEMTDEWQKLQRSWMYLEPIFSTQDIALHMPLEAAKFKLCDVFFRNTMESFKVVPSVIKLSRREGFVGQIIKINNQFELITKGLAAYLESKRDAFARFFFLSNQEIIEILGNARNPRNIQRFLSKIFEGIQNLTFTPGGEVVAMHSKQGENIKLNYGIIPTQATQAWLRELEGVMFQTMRKTIARSLGDFQKHQFKKWVMNWPGQVVLTVCQILYTSNVIDTLEENKPHQLRRVHITLEKQIAQCANLVREPIEHLHRITINSLITINVHLRNTVQHMMHRKVQKVNDFQWMVQLKFVVDQNTKIRVRLINADRPYGYQYLGNSPRLVITPLTDKCYRSLLVALHYNYGGSPEGPAGTGKTQTTKDLAKAIAKQCFVFNCSSSLDYLSMVKFFKGLSSSGAWSCFDEFNRIELDVLSIIAQIIIQIQGAIRRKATDLVLEGTNITFNIDCAIFITMNPSYAGRATLPDNLRALFRPVAMVVPDIGLISEILLYSLGFMYAKTLAHKITKTFELAKQQLTQQDHYEFGLRNIKIVLSWAGILKLQSAGIMEDQTLQQSEKTDEQIDKQGKNPQGASRLGSSASNNRNDKSSDSKRPATNATDNKGKRKHKKSANAQNLIIEDVPDEETIQLLAEMSAQNRLDSIYTPNSKHPPNLMPKMEELNLGISTLDQIINQLNDQQQIDVNYAQYSLKAERKRRITMMQQDHANDIKQEIDNAFQLEFNSDAELQEHLVMRAINDTSCPKLVQQDQLPFKAITKDVFPQSNDQQAEHGNLVVQVKEVIEERNLQASALFTKKVVEYFEILQVRSGVLLLGEPLSGKSSVMQVLADTMNKTRQEEIIKMVQEYKREKTQKLMKAKLRKGAAMIQASRAENQDGGVKITNDQLRMIRAKARNPGVSMYPVNPKSLTLGQLMGFFEDISHDWNDGVFANVMRNCAQDTTKRKKWMIFDGPIDPIWVQNLNSVLDDNKKLSLDSGETIKLNDRMNIVMECDDLSNATMATVSRMGVIYMPENVISQKLIFNNWLLSLPSHLREITPSLDDLFCYLMPSIFRLLTPQNFIYPVTTKWVIYSMTQIMNAFIKDYRNDTYNIASQQLKMFGDSQAKRKIRRTQRQPVISYAQNEGLYQNSLAFKPLWLQAFFIYALTWSVGTILQDKPRSVFIKFMQTKIKGNTDELGTITQVKKRFEQLQQAQEKRGNKRYEPSQNFRKLDKAPLFLAPIPSGQSPFDIYFDFESNQWQVFDYLKIIEKEIELFQLENRSFHQVLVPSEDTIKFNYFLQANLLGMNNVLMMGPTGIGKSLLGKEMIFKGLKPCTDAYLMGAHSFSHITTAQYAQQQFEMRIERRRKGIYGPAQDFKYIFFIDDLHMPLADQYGVHFSNQLLRQWFDYGGWYDLRILDFKKVEDIQFLATITLRDSTKRLLGKRVERHFTVLGLTQDQDSVLQSIFKTLLEFISMQWPTESHQYSEMLIKSSIVFYQSLISQFKPSPAKPHYTFNLRDLFRVFYFMHLAHQDYLSEKSKIQKLWRHQLLRVFTDRFVSNQDHQWINQTLPGIVQENFGGLEITEIPRQGSTVGAGGSKKSSLQDIAPRLPTIHFSPLNAAEYGRYWEVATMEEINAILQQYLSEYNASHRDKINIIVFNYISQQLIKIHRVLIAPYSNLLLVGIAGVGKNTLTRLATYITQYSLEQLSITPQYFSEDWYSDIKRLLASAGIAQNQIVFNISETQLIRSHFLQDVASLIKNGEVPGIYNREEYESVIAQMAAKLTEMERQNSTPPINYSRFVWKCRKFMHIVFSVSPVGSSFRRIIMQHPACVSCASVLWMQEWPEDGLRTIANAFIKGIPDLNQVVMEKICNACISMHQVITNQVQDFTVQTGQLVYFTPKLYVEMFVTYRNLLKSKREEISDIRRRYLAGVSQLEKTHKLIEVFQKISDKKTPVLQAKQKEITRSLRMLKEEADILSHKREQVMREEEQCREKMAEAQEIKAECEKALDQARPSLNQANKELQQLTKDDLTEMKSLNNPPNAVKLVAQGVCVLLGIKPKKAKLKDGTSILDYWGTATTKKFLGSPTVLNKLISYNKQNISPETMQKTQVVMGDQDFNAQAVTHACIAARGMYFWLKAIRQYHYIWQTVKPQHEQLKKAEMQYQQKWQQLSAKKVELEQLQARLKDMKAKHLEQQLEVRSFQREIDDCVLKTNRATKLKAALGGQGTKWKVYSRMLSKKIDTLTGDALLGAVLVTYLSVMTQKHRDKILFELHSKISDEFKIDVSDIFLFNRLFGDDIKIREWVMNNLPMDSFSITNAIIMQESSRFPICIDPHNQANAWLKTQQGSDLIVLKFSDSSFNKSLELGVKFGKTVLVQNVGQHIDLTIYPLLRAHSQPQNLNEQQGGGSGGIAMPGANRKQIMLGGSLIEIDSNFKLLMTSQLYTPHFLPQVFSLCALINFIVTFDALRAQMLGIVVETQHPELQERRLALSKQAFANIKNNKELESNILDWVSKNVQQLLDDQKLLEAIHTSQKTSQFIAQKLRTINNTTNKINIARNVYIPVAYRAATLYFVVLDLKKLNPMYQFSLGWFTRLFVKALTQTETEPSQNRKVALDRRLTAMINNFTVEVFNRINTFIYDTDKMIFQYHLFFKILLSEDCLDRPLYNFFMKCATDQLVYDKKKKLKEEVPVSEEKSKGISDILGGDGSTTVGVPPGSLAAKQSVIVEENKVNEQKSSTLQVPTPVNNAQTSQQPGKGQNAEATKEEGQKRKNADQDSGSDDLTIRTQSFQQIPLGDQQTLVEVNNPLDRFTWITQKMKNQFYLLENVRPFKSPPITQHMIDCYDEWQQYFQSLDAQTSQPPIPYGNIRVPDLKAYQIGSNIRKKRLAKLSQIKLLMRMQSRSISQFSYHKDIDQSQFQDVSEIGAPHQQGQEQNEVGSQVDMTQQQKRGIDQFDAKINEQEKKQGDGVAKKGSDQDADSDTSQSVVVDAMVDGVHDFLQYTSQNPMFDERQKAIRVKMNIALISLCVIQIIRPDKVLNALQYYITSSLDQRLKEATPDKLFDIYMNETTKKTPVLFMLGQGLNPLGQLNKLKAALPDGNQIQMQYMALGKGQGDKIESLILRASRVGNWVLLENLHLVANFLPNVQKVLNSLDPNNVRDTFRLFLTCTPIKNFPITLLRDCLKLTMSAAKGVKQNLKLLLNPLKSLFFEQVPHTRKEQFKKIFFSVCLLHTVLLERKKFGPIGWNVIYNFSQDDFRVSYAQIISQLQQQDPGDDRVNFRILQYLISEINYGGRITNSQDIQTLKSFVYDWINPQVMKDSFYFSQNEEYYIPQMPEGLISLSKYVQSLPVEESTDIFGLHPNAEIQMQRNRAKTLIEQLSSLEMTARPIDDGFLDMLLGDKQAAEMKMKLVNLQQTLPQALNLQNIREKYKITDPSDTLSILLIRQVDKYNTIINAIKTPLDNALKAISGVIYMSSELQGLCASLFIDKIPDDWLKISYPTFPRLGWFMNNLKSRVDFIKEWVQNGHPDKIWLGGLIDPANLFIALQQQLARKLKLPLQQIGLNFQVNFNYSGDMTNRESCNFTTGAGGIEDIGIGGDLSQTQTALNSVRDGGGGSSQHNANAEFGMTTYSQLAINHVNQSLDSKNNAESLEQELPPLKLGERYLRGLYLQGAEMDESNCLKQPKLREQYYRMRPILVQAINLDEEAMGRQSSDLRYRGPRFSTPLYKLSMRQSQKIKNNENSLILQIPLPMRINQEITSESVLRQKNHWLKRGAALLCEVIGD